MAPRAEAFLTRTWAPRFVGRCFFSESRRFLAIARMGGMDIAPSILERSSCVKRFSKGLTTRKRRPYSDCSQITSQMSCLGSFKTLCHSLTHQLHAELSQSLGHRRKLSFAIFKSEASFSIFLAMRAWRSKSFDNEIRWSRKLPVRSNSESDRLRLTVTYGSSRWSQDLVSSTWKPNRFVLRTCPACFRCFDANVRPSSALHHIFVVKGEVVASAIHGRRSTRRTHGDPFEGDPCLKAKPQIYFGITIDLCSAGDEN
jgi:hypothetical protein